MNPSNLRRLSIPPLLMLAALLYAPLAPANDDGAAPAIDDSAVKMSIIEPERDVGYTVGDIIERTVTLEVKKPYVMQTTSLPIVGYEHRYKGQVSGIELRRIRHEEMDNGDSHIYTLYLAYQVFTNNVVAKPAILPAERIKFSMSDAKSGKTKIVQYRIPSWGFRISPLATFGAVKIETDMSPFRPPLLLDASREQLRAKVLTGVLAVSLLGLLYILGMHAWLPLMGRPFAQAYRKLRKLPATTEGLEQGVSHVHQALNTTAGYSVFSDSLGKFLTEKPAYAAVHGELEQFFALSRRVFFASPAQNLAQMTALQSDDAALSWLRSFCRHCRDCERGLVPDTQITRTA